MNRRRIVVFALLAGVLVAGLWVRHFLAPENVIRRGLRAGMAAFEQERMLGATKPVSRAYRDRWGMTYESLAGHMREVMDTYDGLHVDLEPFTVEVHGEEASTALRFILWGSYEGTRGYVIGSLQDPCTATLQWREESVGWRIISISELDIPELRDELAERRLEPD